MDEVCGASSGGQEGGGHKLDSTSDPDTTANTWLASYPGTRLANGQVEDCTCISAAKKPRRECHSWREEFPSIQ